MSYLDNANSSTPYDHDHLTVTARRLTPAKNPGRLIAFAEVALRIGPGMDLIIRQIPIQRGCWNSLFAGAPQMPRSDGRAYAPIFTWTDPSGDTIWSEAVLDSLFDAFGPHCFESGRPYQASGDGRAVQ
jgi:hypothetical protein